MKKLLLGGLLILFPLLIFAQEFRLDADYRARYEHRRGWGTLRPDADENDAAANFISQRARLIAYYKSKSERLDFKMAIQDVRTWGATPQLGVVGANLALHEAWAAVHLDSNSFLRVGRQELNFDDSRFLGNVDWIMPARAHDAIMFQHKSSFLLQLGAAVHTNRETLFREPYTVSNYKAMQFIRFKQEFDFFNLMVLFFNNGQEIAPANPSRSELETVYSQTYGIRSEFRLGLVDLDVNFYLQGGKDATNTKIRAFNLRPEGRINVDDNLKIVAGFEWLSGTDTEFGLLGGGQGIRAEDKNYSYSPFYGTNHKFNGYMDYFYVGNHFNNVGLQDYYGGVNIKVDKTSYYGRVHFFGSWADMIQQGQEIDHYLGIEIDLTAKYTLNEWINFQGGVSTMIADENMETLKGGDAGKFNYWGWAMLIVKPNLFTIRK
ncbi:alginate export family protein [Algivirga pacifica]|uniref:Alginate export family protein n=1 Tax=Algivirga pacifica TaxID=1162670 RepID=A0ABP9DDU6_9BACT